MGEQKKSIFVRDATGLTKAISARDAIIVTALWYAFWGAWYNWIFVATYPGANILVSVILGTLGMLIVGAVYLGMSLAMPRTGGDYIWTSRSLFPLAGFAVSFFLTIADMSFVPLNSANIVSTFVNSGLVGTTLITGNSAYANLATTLAHANVWIPYVFSALPLVMLLGVRRTTRVFWLAAIPALIAIVLFVGIAFTTGGNSGFISRFNSLNSGSYESIISAAQSSGFNTGFNTSGTLLGTAYAVLLVIGFPSAYFVGEIKSAQKVKTQSYATFGGIILITIYSLVLFGIVYFIVGAPFFHSLSFLYVTGSSHYSLPFSNPEVGDFVAYMTNISFMPLLVNLLLAISMVGTIISFAFLAVRNFFAWSFDRAVPQALATVDSKGNPWVAILVATIISEVYTYLYLETPTASYLSYVVFGWMLAYVVIGIAVTVFPFRKRDAFSSASLGVRRKVGGFPLMSVAGIGMTIFSILMAYASVSPNFIGALNPIYLVVVGIIYGIGIVIYAVAYLVRRYQGIPLNLAMSEIPPE